MKTTNVEKEICNQKRSKISSTDSQSQGLANFLPSFHPLKLCKLVNFALFCCELRSRHRCKPRCVKSSHNFGIHVAAESHHADSAAEWRAPRSVGDSFADSVVTFQRFFVLNQGLVPRESAVRNLRPIASVNRQNVVCEI